MPANSPLITTRFDATSTADDVVVGVDLSGVRAVVTGASSGIGVETARSLARAGAEVTLAVRNTDNGRKAAEDIAESTGQGDVRVAALDLADRASVAGFVQSWNGPLHLLINNAGVITPALARTAEGWELQFATNYLGHFALSLGLHDALAAGAGERGEARIISLSSGAHMRSPIVFDDIQFERRDYDPQAAYAQSKTATSLFAVEATRRWSPDGIVANAVNPGGVATGLQRHFTQKQKDYLAEAEAAGAFAWKTAQQGAATTLVAAVASEFAHTGGHYLDDGREAYTVPNDADLFQNSHGVKQWAIDPGTAQELWEVSLSHRGSALPVRPASRSRGSSSPRHWCSRCSASHSSLRRHLVALMFRQDGAVVQARAVPVFLGYGGGYTVDFLQPYGGLRRPYSQYHQYPSDYGGIPCGSARPRR